MLQPHFTSMKTPYRALAALALAGAMLAGCGGDDGSRVTAANMKAFESASAGIQEAWRTALAAKATNGYVVAITTLRGLGGQELTLDQAEAVQNAMRATNIKLNEEVARGNAAAIAAQQELQAGAVRR